MTRDQIIDAAREAGFNPCGFGLLIVRQPDGSWVVDISDELERFTNITRQQALEDAAKVCQSRYMGDNNREDQEAKRCAAAIRSMKT